MTKPQIASEPSMEDILASIRKMISEDGQGPRPVPDQIARTTIGDAPAAKSTAKSANWDAEPAPAATPDPAPEDQAAASAKPRPERTSPSFSSLSDALKTAQPTPTRASLDDKIADMLQNEKEPASSEASAAPLAVFAANRPSQKAPVQAEARPTNGASTPSRPAARTPSDPASAEETRMPSKAPATPTLAAALRARPAAMNGSANGAAHNPRENSAEEDPITQARNTTARGARDDARSKSLAASLAAPKGLRPLNGEAKPETQRVVTMPARFPTASSTDDAGHASSDGTAMNGKTALGLRPLSRQTPSAPPETSSSEVRAEAPVNVEAPVKVGAPAHAEAPPAPVAPSTAETISIPSSPASVPFQSEVPEAVAEEPDEAVTEAVAPAPAPQIVLKDSGDALQALRRAAIASVATAAAKSADATSPAVHQPSEALVDAVVDMVHAEPSSLSVFASGSAFIHGVKADAHHDEHAPFAAPAGAGPAAKPGEERKLDRTAAELLRPMLRQWLAENMTRIVEEALRSELQSSQGSEKVPGKA